MSETFEFMKQKNALTVNEKGVAVVPLSQFEWKTYPITAEDKVIYVTPDHYLGLHLKVYQFTSDLLGIEMFDNVLFNEFRIARLMQR